MTNYNWKSYNILTTGEFSSEDITLQFTKGKIKSNAHTTKVIEQSWMDAVKGNKSVGRDFWDSTVYSLGEINQKQNVLNLEVGEVTFKELQGTNATNWILGDILGQEFLANAILVQSIVKTSDDKYILGNRNTKHKNQYKNYAIFGGTIDKDEIVIKKSSDLFSAINLELNQEITLKKSDIHSQYLFSIVQDWKYNPLLLFMTKTRLNSTEVKDLFSNTTEHADIVCWSLKEVIKLMREKEEMFSDITLIAFDIYNKEKKVRH